MPPVRRGHILHAVAMRLREQREEVARIVALETGKSYPSALGETDGAIELGLVDELRMFRNPVVVGGGTPFLPPVNEDVVLDLIETRTFGSRVIFERYRRAGR